jgi:4-amino-4-deoxy-L-arabinose transferase-like glycosyltransferase
VARYGAIAVVLLVLAFTTYVRLRVADVPLERDEGEYAYAGQLILQGIPPYSLAYNMKFPGTYYAYAALMAVFGETAWGVHAGLLVVTIATTLLVFLLGRRLAGDFAAAVAACAFAILAIDRWVMGVFAHATHFVLPFAIGGLLLLTASNPSRHLRRTLIAGSLLGLAVLMKQQALPFIALGLAWIAWTDWRSTGLGRETARRAAALAIGALIPLAAICVIFAAQGVLGRFWFWTFQYAREYVSEVPLAEAWPSFQMGWRDITRQTWPIWWLAGLGILTLWFGRWPGDLRARVTFFVLASVLAILPGFFFRQHYFILLLPAAATCAGLAAAALDRGLSTGISRRAARLVTATIVATVLGAYVFAEREYLFSMPVRDLSRSVYGANPFVEAPDIARYIESRTSPDDRIAVFGSEPEIYFYSRRKSATGYIYTYALMEPQPYASRMQDEMIREIEAAAPRYVVAVLIGTSWLARPSSDQRILSWFQRYMTSCYTQVGLVDIHSVDSTTFKWDAEGPGYKPQSQNLVAIYGRTGPPSCTGG